MIKALTTSVFGSLSTVLILIRRYVMNKVNEEVVLAVIKAIEAIVLALIKR